MIKKTLVVDEETRYLRRESIRSYLDYLCSVYGNEVDSRLEVLSNHTMDLDIASLHTAMHYSSLRVTGLEDKWGMQGRLISNISQIIKLNGIRDARNFHYELNDGLSTRLLTLQYRNEVGEHNEIKVPLNEFSEYRKLKSYIATMKTYKSKYAKRTNTSNNNITVTSYKLAEKLDKSLINTYKISVDFYHADNRGNKLHKRRLLSSIDHLIKSNSYIATILLLSDISMNYTFYAPHINLDAIQKYLIDSDSLLDCIKDVDADTTFILTVSVKDVLTDNMVHSVIFQHNCGVVYF